MSTLFFIDYISKNSNKIEFKEFDTLLKKVAKDNGFGIRFIKEYKNDSTDDFRISYQFSDNDSMQTCSDFMASIIYDADCKPFIDDLMSDIRKLYNFITFSLSLNGINAVELRLSDGEVDEYEYKIININISQLYGIIISEYLKAIDIPTIKILITA